MRILLFFRCAFCGYPIFRFLILQFMVTYCSSLPIALVCVHLGSHVLGETESRDLDDMAFDSVRKGLFTSF